MEFLSYSLKQIDEVAEAILSFTKTCPIILFRAEMGAGKTTLISKLCEIKGMKGTISSPTFSLVNEYEMQDEEILYHFDFYRIEDESEAYDMGIFEYFESGNICLIEWPEKINNLIPVPHIEVKIEMNDLLRNYQLEMINK